MIIIEVMGGLGNQMQQYALYRKMKHLGKDAKLDISWFQDEKRQDSVLARRKLELEYFENLPMDICTREEKERLIGKDDLLGKLKRKLLPGQNRHFYESDMYHPEIFEFDDMYLSGYWACEKYYADILDELRSLIKFPDTLKKTDNSIKYSVETAKNNTERNCTEKSENSEYSENEDDSGEIRGKLQGCGVKNTKIICNDQKKTENEVDGEKSESNSAEVLNCQNCLRNCNEDSKCGKAECLTLNIQTIAKMQSEMSVSIHVRRGDYLDPENTAMFGGICTEEYYDAAIHYILEQCPDAHFYVFSDDSAYVKEKYSGPRCTIVDWNTGENSFFDIQLMSSCKHNICANSTFSFWGARLNPNPDKIMVRPAKHKNSQQIIPEKMHELWEKWVLIDGDGRIV